MQALLYANLTDQTLSTTLGGAELTFPTLIQGDDLTLGIRTTETLEGDDVETDRDFKALRAGIGRIDTAPTGGTFRLAIDAVATGDITYPFTAAELATELSLTVAEDNGTFIITSGTEIAITVDRNCLTPISFIRIGELPDCGDGNYHYTLRFQQTLVAYTETWSEVVPQSPSIEVVQTGFDYEGYELPTIQHLTIPPSFRGTFRLQRELGVFTTPLSRSSSPAEIKTALDRIADDGGYFSVDLVFDGTARIIFDGSMNGIDYDALTVTVIDAPPGDPTFTLSLNTTELEAVMRGVDTITLPLEIEAEIYKPGSETLFDLVTLYRGDVTILEQILREEDAEAQAIDWLTPPLPRTYVPFESDQVITGSQHFTFSLSGDGAVNHNLDTTYIDVPMFDSTGHMLEDSEFTVDLNGSNSIDITFTGSPSFPVAGFVRSAGPVSAFQSHTHTTAQITGLDTILSTLAGRITALEAFSVSGTFSRADEVDYSDEWNLPRFWEIFPYLGSAAQPDAPATLGDLDLSTLPAVVPSLFPAIHDASATALTVSGGLITTVASDGNKYTLFQNQSGGDVTIPLSSRLVTDDDPYGYNFILPDDGYAANDGSNWIPLAQYGDGTESSYYARTQERTLWQDTVADRQLTVGRAVETRFALEVAAFKANTPWHWYLVIEIADLTSDDSPATTGGNLAEDDWSTDSPSFEQRLVIPIDTPKRYHFGFRVIREAAVAQREKFTCIADSSDSLDGTYFQLSDEDGTVGVWIDTTGVTTIPAGASALDRAIEVTTIATDDTDEDVATAVAAAIDADDKFTATSSGAVVTVIHATAGPVADGADGDTGFTTFTVTTNGSTGITAEALAFGEWIAATAPTTGEFAVRCRLVRADTVNRISAPRGFLAVLGFTSSSDTREGKVTIS